MIADIIVGVVLLVSSIIAFLRGFIREVLTIIGVVGALAAAYFGGPILAPIFEGWFGVNADSDDVQKLFGVLPMSLLADVSAYSSIFIIVVITLSLSSHLLAEAAKTVGLGPLDRTLGVLFGLLRGVILISILYMPLYLLNDEKTKEVLFQDSHTHIYLENIAQYSVQYLPQSAQNAIGNDSMDVEAIKETTRENLETIDLLKKDGLTNEDVDRIEGALGEAAEQAVEGYTDEFRDNMQQLIEDADAVLQEQELPQPSLNQDQTQ